MLYVVGDFAKIEPWQRCAMTEFRARRQAAIGRVRRSPDEIVRIDKAAARAWNRGTTLRSPKETVPFPVSVDVNS